MFKKSKNVQEVKLPPPAPLRTVAEIQQEYTSVCTRAGHVQYQLYTNRKDLEVLNDTLRSLNQEALKSQEAEKAKAEADKAAAVAVVPSAEVGVSQ